MKQILKISPRAFWDTDFSKIDANRDTHYADIICRIFDRGTDEDLQAIIEYYGYDKIKQVLTTEEFLTERSFPKAIAYLGLKSEDFKYHTSKKWECPRHLQEFYNIKSKNMKQKKPYPISEEIFISQSEEAKTEQQEMITNYKKAYHYCEYTTMTQNWGDAIKHCYEDNDGSFWAGHDEYESKVNYCPFCGAKAPVQATELNEIPDKEKKRLHKIDHALEVSKEWNEAVKLDAKRRYQKDIDHLKSLIEDDHKDEQKK